jgi:hypothetical protein
VQDVVNELRARCGETTRVENLTLQEEDVAFKLPPGLVQIWRAHRSGADTRATAGASA